MSGHSREPGRTVMSRALAVLDTFDAKHPLLTLSAIARRADLPVATVLADLAARPAGQHVVVTGRGAPPEEGAPRGFSGWRRAVDGRG